MSIALTNNYDEEQTSEDGNLYADDKKLLVRFEVRAVKNEFETNKQGRPVYYDQEYIQIIIPGNRDVSSYPLDDQYKARFKDRYNKWKNEGVEALSNGGTILAELPWMTKSQIAELAHWHIHTVEQLAEMSDINAMKFMGNNQLRERAKNFLKAAAGEAPALALQQALEQRDLHIQTLQGQVDAMKAAIEKLEKNRR